MGYFDGDGCICLTKGSLDLKFCGTPTFLATLQAIIHDRTKISTNGCLWNAANNSYGMLSYGGTHTPLAVYDWMYQSADLSLVLKRKYMQGQFFNTIMHLPVKQRKIEIETFKQSQEYLKVSTCQVPDCECPQKLAKNSIQTIPSQ